MAVETVQPTDYRVRSFLYRALLREGAHFHEVAEAAVAAHYGHGQDEEIQQARRLGLADLSPLARSGFKGREAIGWVRQQGLEIGEDNNRAYPQSTGDGALVARLADTEALILGERAGTGALCTRLDQAYETDKPPGCTRVPRGEASAWFMVTGEHAGTMFAKLCGVDMRHHKFMDGAVAQTSMARMTVIAVRDDLDEVPAFHLLFDSASAEYLWGALRDAMAEFEGAPVGHAALLALSR